jgi:hypothetical protein
VCEKKEISTQMDDPRSDLIDKVDPGWYSHFILEEISINFSGSGFSNPHDLSPLSVLNFFHRVLLLVHDCDAHWAGEEQGCLCCHSD